MNILVTGGAGFIGSHLIDRLMEQGHRVCCIDNLYTGQQRNIAHWQGHDRFQFQRHDIVEPFVLGDDQSWQQIYHLACPASPVHYQADPIKTIKTSVIGTIHVLELARKTNARVLLASTSEVYGDPEVHPQSEDYRGCVNPIGIRACYDEGKRLAETLMFDYYRQHKVEIRVARIFNTYGPRLFEQDGRVVSNFIIQALQGKALTVYGSGSQTRSFCYVSDLVEGLQRLMNSDYVGPINLGNPDEYTILELAEKIQELINPDAALRFEPLPQDDPKQRRPDISRAHAYLGWQPTVSLAEGLKHTIADFRERLSLS